MREIKKKKLLFTGVFILVFSSQTVFSFEGGTPAKRETPVSIPPDSEITYEESIIRKAEEKAEESNEKATSDEAAEGYRKEPDPTLLDFRRRLLDEQQQQLQRTIAEDSQR